MNIMITDFMLLYTGKRIIKTDIRVIYEDK